MKTPPLQLIESFLAFAKAKNMALAAVSLEISQPALTSHLQKFEEYFPQAVFMRDGRKKVLTPFGLQLESLLLQRIGSLDHELRALTESVVHPENAHLKIAGRGEILNFLAAKMRFPGRLIFIEADGAMAVEGLIEKRYDIAISNHTERAASFQGKRLFSDQFHIVCPKKWMINGKTLSKSLLRELAEKPFFAYKEEDSRLNAVWNHFGEGACPSAKVVLANWRVLVAMVEDGQGWTISPSRYLKALERSVHFAIPISVVAGTDFFAIYRKESASIPWFRPIVNELGRAFTDEG